jgi:hypothetical protein
MREGNILMMDCGHLIAYASSGDLRTFSALLAVDFSYSYTTFEHC